ncbi:acetylglutamate semialdehyde dehydrogenase [Alkalihalophilus marmarensis]|uniref:acetylglutamate semialdehyde dehydrogenase n=1 Tax=Alkalihalophilus marmarensis TaxID=521377 RepID=UPI002E1F45E4|nr:acetylglutamate semialdehyde dehydrogenase [Alkalihalophilus marmarensis]
MNGFTTSDFLKENIISELNIEEAKYKIITSLSNDEKQIYSDLLNKLIKLHSSKEKYSNAQKGKALENIVTFLLEKSTVFDVKNNIRSTTNEIDQLITINAKGRRFREKGFLDLTDNTLLSECKNYKDKVSVTWVGKFASLIYTSQVKIGLLFSYHGLTGNNWSAATGLTKKIFLGSPEEKKIYILDFNISDFKKIEEGSNLLELIRLKMISIQNDVQFDNLITPHPAEE